MYLFWHLKEFRDRSIKDGGAKFLDKSALWHYEGSYNFSDALKFVDVVVGGNFRNLCFEF